MPITQPISRSKNAEILEAISDHQKEVKQNMTVWKGVLLELMSENKIPFFIYSTPENKRKYHFSENKFALENFPEDVQWSSLEKFIALFPATARPKV